MFPNSAEALHTNSLFKRLRESAEHFADSIAVKNSDGTSLTYREIFGRAAGLAKELRSAGVRPGDRVGLLFPRGSRFIEAILATLSLEAVYVPLDVCHPLPRISYILDDSKVQVLLTEQGIGVATPEHLYRIETDLIAPCDTEDFMVAECDPNRAIYSIYTSGSTGRPKGVDVSERNLMALINAIIEIYDLSAPHVWTFFHSPAFDYSVWEIFAPILFGNRIVCVDGETTVDPDRFLDLVISENVTFLNQTPSAFYRLIEDTSASRRRKWQAAKLRWIVLGGEALSYITLGRWLEFGRPEIQLVNMYGITETCVISTCHVVPQQALGSEKQSVIGKPLASLTIHLLDEHRNPVPVGEQGEAWIGGPQVSLGYFGRPDLTSERFVFFPNLPSEGPFYRSGDLMIERPDGNFVYCGRIDNQVNMGGFRIELEEVENALLSLLEVKDVCAAVDGTGETSALIAFVAVSSSCYNSASIRALLKERGQIPDYMIPNHIVCVDSLPLTINGKKDRKRLLELYNSNKLPAQAPINTANYLKSNEIEGIRAAWIRILGHCNFTNDDNFFDVGGTSLRAVKVHSILSSEIMSNVPFSIVSFFEHPTVNGLALLIETTLHRPSPSASAALEREKKRQSAVDRAKGLRGRES